MKEEIKTRWLSALRSGEYIQGIGRLKNADNSFCCLGVLCDLATKDGVGKWEIEDHPDKKPIYLGPDQEFSSAFLNTPVREWADLNSPNPRVRIDSSHPKAAVFMELFVQLSTLNDGGLSFTEIANLIEETL